MRMKSYFNLLRIWIQSIQNRVYYTTGIQIYELNNFYIRLDTSHIRYYSYYNNLSIKCRLSYLCRLYNHVHIISTFLQDLNKTIRHNFSKPIHLYYNLYTIFNRIKCTYTMYSLRY